VEKIEDKNEDEGKEFRVRYREYDINEKMYRFPTRKYREIFRDGFKT